MRLRDWLKRENLSVREFATRIGEDDSIVRKWVYGQRQPSLPKAVLINQHTDGAVSAADLLMVSADPSSATEATGMVAA